MIPDMGWHLNWGQCSSQSVSMTHMYKLQSELFYTLCLPSKNLCKREPGPGQVTNKLQKATSRTYVMEESEHRKLPSVVFSFIFVFAHEGSKQAYPPATAIFAALSHAATAEDGAERTIGPRPHPHCRRVVQSQVNF
ncbi:Hypothetical predicted protein [Podarcis lilfordi]|uniref:Uncharacterized protein n=1 Tax=Podarcis lilfordi TaxID=74358 RepID=A0AA35JRR9_9SAUR|nr:Hypothetical predicted protein [Podarcis lilfordi]